MVLKQPIDYSFIAQAGSQLGSAISSIPEEKRKEDEYAQKKKLLDEQFSDLKVDKIDVQEAYSSRISEMAKEYDALAGDGKGIVKARQFLSPYMQSEDPKDAVARMAIQTDKWKKFIEDEKVRQFQAKSANTSPVGPEGPVQTMTLPEMSAYGAEQGITQRPEFKGRVQQQQDVEAGMLYAPGQTQGEYGALVASQGGDPSVGAAKEIKSGLMSDNQIAIDSRQRDIADQRARLRAVNDKMVETRLRAGNVDKNTLRLLDSQIRAVQAQIKASENRSEIALGLKTGKDWEGKAVYSTGPEWKAEFEDAESTYTSAQKLLDYIDQLNKRVNPIPATPTAGAAPRPRRSLDSFSK